MLGGVLISTIYVKAGGVDAGGPTGLSAPTDQSGSAVLDDDPSGETLTGDETPTGDDPSGETPTGNETPTGDDPSGETPTGNETPTGDDPSGETPTGNETPTGDDPSGETPTGNETPTGGDPSGETPTGNETPTGDDPSGETPTGNETPTGDDPSGETPTGNETPTGDDPSGETPTGDGTESENVPSAPAVATAKPASKPNPEPAVPAYVPTKQAIFLRSTLNKIATTPAGGTLVIDGRDSGIYSYNYAFMQEILKNRAATYVIKCRYNGVEFEITISAGANIVLDENVPWCGPLYFLSGALGKDVKVVTDKPVK